MKRRTRVFARLALVAVAILFALSIVELVLRWHGYRAFRWSPTVNARIITATGDPELPYVLTPGSEGWGWGTDIKVNAHGFRDRDYDIDKGDRVRIAAIGDSITFGTQLPASAAFPEQLEALLETGWPASRTEVLNFGVTGYDVVNNVEHLRVRALPFRPDLVLLGFCVNDIGTFSTAIGYIRVAKYLSNPIFRLRVSQYIASTGLRLLAAGQSGDDNDLDVFRRIHRSRIRPVDDDPELLAMVNELEELGGPTSSLAQWWTQAPRLGLLEYAFDTLRTLQREYDFEVVVVAIPLLDPRTTERWRLVHRIIRHESLKYGFHFVDVYDDFEKAGLGELRSHRLDMIHPNAQGHAIVARRVYEYLAASRLLPGAPR